MNRNKLFSSGIVLLLLFGALLAGNSSCTSHLTDNQPSGRFDSIDVQANYFNERGDRARAVAFLDSAYAIKKNATRFSRIRRYGAIAHLCIFPPADYAAGIKNVDSELLVIGADSVYYSKDYLKALLLKARILINLNESATAFNYYFRVKLFAQQYFNSCYTVDVDGELSAMAFQQMQYGQAATYLREENNAIKSCFAADSLLPLKMQGVYDNLGLCYAHLGMPDSALLCYRKSLDYIALYEKNSSVCRATQDNRAIVLGNMGSAFMDNGSIEEAERLFKENLAIYAAEGNNSEDAMITRAKLARLYLAEGRYPDALSGILTARQELDSLPDASRELAWLSLATEYYDTTGDKQSAYNYFKKYIKLRDSLEARKGLDISRSLADVTRDNEMADLQSEYKVTRVSLLVAVAFVVLVLAIMFLVWTNYKTSKRNVQALTRLNEQINKQANTLKKTLGALQQSQQDNANIMKVVAHDLQNPLAAMVSLADLLGIEDDPTERQAYVDMLKSSGMTAIRLSRSILQSAPVLVPEMLDLKELIGQSVALLQFRAKEKKQKIVFESASLLLTCDREKIWRVVNNLLSNAVKFSYEGGTITVKLQKKNDNALITVKDEGVGIPEGLKTTIFKHLTIAGREGTAGEQSHGMGLSIVKQLVDAHNGKIWFESTEGSGTTFFVELPM